MVRRDPAVASSKGGILIHRASRRSRVPARPAVQVAAAVSDHALRARLSEGAEESTETDALDVRGGGTITVLLAGHRAIASCSSVVTGARGSRATGTRRATCIGRSSAPPLHAWLVTAVCVGGASGVRRRALAAALRITLVAREPAGGALRSVPRASRRTVRRRDAGGTRASASRIRVGARVTLSTALEETTLAGETACRSTAGGERVGRRSARSAR